MGDDILLKALEEELGEDKTKSSNSEDDDILEAIIHAGKDAETDLLLKYL